MPADQITNHQGNYDEFLSTPQQQGYVNTQHPRCAAEYQSKGDKFLIEKRSFERQYSQLYFARLMLLTPVIKKRAQQVWPNTPVVKILELVPGKEVAIIGTAFKDMKLKPSIMDEYTKDRSMKVALGHANFCSEDDTIILEDEGARVVVRGDEFPVHDLVTGVVLAVKGTHDADGDFLVSGVCYAGLPAQPPLPVLSEDKYVAFISGLALAHEQVDMLKLQMLVDFLAGNLGSSADQHLASQVVQLVVAGGVIGAQQPLATAQPYSRQQSVALQPVKDLDMLLTELSAALPVDIMAGADDPTNFALPQQPLHRCLFPAAASYASFRRVTNPHHFSLDGVLLLGTSGQNISDIAKYARTADVQGVMKNCLEWRHLAPTAPDTLTCYPYYDDDPFVLDVCPHVLFAGNQPHFAELEYSDSDGKKVRLVGIPSFAATGTLVLLNLRTLECHTRTFDH